LVVTEIIFQIVRKAIGDCPPFRTLSAEVAAPPVGVVRDTLAHNCSIARLLARRIGLHDVGRRANVDLALAHVAFLELRVVCFGGSLEIFQFLRMRVGDIPPFQTLCAEVAAKFVVKVERDALARLVNIARLPARPLVGGIARRFGNKFLALGVVALLAVKSALGGGSCKIFQFLRMRVGDRSPFRTRSTEVAAVPVAVVRDTLAFG
jgi:hypothetical protein